MRWHICHFILIMLKKNILELCLLYLIAEDEGYGYELLKRLHSTFPDTQESAGYALIRSLQKDGYIDAAGQKTANGPPRKYYHITPKGSERLSELLSTWRALVKGLEGLGIS